jgi:hypothetical protein
MSLQELYEAMAEAKTPRGGNFTELAYRALWRELRTDLGDLLADMLYDIGKVSQKYLARRLERRLRQQVTDEVESPFVKGAAQMALRTVDWAAVANWFLRAIPERDYLDWAMGTGGMEEVPESVWDRLSATSRAKLKRHWGRR